MNRIGGNVTAQIQVKTEAGRNRLGEKVDEWSTVYNVIGFLDLSSGDSRYTNFNAKVQESTHVFICDFVSMSKNVSNKRLVIDDEVYDIKLIDDPMNLHEHLEIYLAYVG